MSGFAALFNRDGRPTDEALASAMLDAIPYRGPDGSSTRHFGVVALGHAKMAVTPEDEEERQPLVSSRTGCAVVADVRLDNRGDLLSILPDWPSAATSDAEVILRAYEAFGAGCFGRLLGDFAFVLWDPRRQELVCARDTSGQRTLFYRVDRESFAAASEIHQLLRDGSVPVRPNEERIREFLTPLNMFRNEKDNPSTFFEGICSVPAGHVLVVSRDKLTLDRYWRLAPPSEIRYRSELEYAEHYRSLFYDVVQARLRSARPIGVLLSGGIDSSSIACTAQELLRHGRAAERGFLSFTSVFDGLDCDERGRVQEIQAKYGFDARFIEAGTYGGRLQLDPNGFLEAPNMGVRESRDVLLAAVSRENVRVLLMGDIADSCVGGTRMVFDSLLRHLQFTVFREHLRAYRRVSGDSLRKILALYCLGPLLPIGIQRWLTAAYVGRNIRRHWQQLLPGWLPERLRDDLAARHLELSLAAERDRLFSNPTREWESRLLYPPEIARHPAPWPIEFWRPFADRRLHEFLLAIPPEQKFSPHPGSDDFYAGSKRLVRRAMSGILPDNVRTLQSKVQFGGVLENEVRRNWPVYENAFMPSAAPEIVKRGYVEHSRFWSRLEALRDGVVGGDIVYLMQVVGLESWLRTFSLPRSQLIPAATQSVRAKPVLMRGNGACHT